MPNLNKVMLMGNLTRDPEVKYTPKGTAVAQISLAINRHYSTDQGEKREETTFVDCELWGRQAELAGEYLKKGRPRLKLDTWDDKTTGTKRSKMRVVCENMQFLGSRYEGGQEEESDSAEDEPPPRQPRAQRSAPPAQRPATPPTPSRKPIDPDLDTPDDDSDIPF